MFKALADPTRRSLLAELFREDGQTLSALERPFAWAAVTPFSWGELPIEGAFYRGAEAGPLESTEMSSSVPLSPS